MNILIVDDDPVALALLEKVLLQAGHSVDTARDGEEAWRHILEGDVRMVISDWNMPNLDGTELCRRIRSHGLPFYVYFMLVTARTDTEAKVRGLSEGADDLVTKPFDPEELRQRVRAGERILALETRHCAIFAMAKLVESRDPETGNHLERVRCYAQMIALALSQAQNFSNIIDGEFVNTIYLTSPLHDIGKIGIPDSILMKAGILTDAEFDTMKSHTTIGAKTLDAALGQYPGVEYLRMARDIAATHHERYDGSGYPRGLKGDNIPLCGRIVAIADTYDAMTSKRVYASPRPHEIARSIICCESSRQFDPRVVAAFLDVEEEFEACRRRFSDTPSDDAAARQDT